jgi:hypothetical protein
MASRLLFLLLPPIILIAQKQKACEGSGGLVTTEVELQTYK